MSMARRRTERKYRRCQECGHVAAASAFRRAPRQGTLPLGTEVLVVCPGCGHVAPYWAFPLTEPPRGERAPS